MTGALQKRAVSIRFSKRNKVVWPILFGWLALATSALAAPAFSPPPARWTVGAAWTIDAVYRQPDDSWTKPVSWRFVVQSMDAQKIQLRVTGTGTSSGTLTFDRSTGALLLVDSTDTFKGESIHRDVRFDGAAPVYPLLTAIPFYFPAPQNQGDTASLKLSRWLNGRRVGTETLTQTVADVNADTLTSALHDSARDDVDRLLRASAHTAVQSIEISKNDSMVFIQFWMEGYPWAIYTHGPSCRAWLVETNP